MYPHRIRLRGPWEYEPLGSSALPKSRMSVPCRWDEAGLKDFVGRVRFQRRFGRPRRLEAHERVWLTFDGVLESANVWLNGQSLGKCGSGIDPFEWEVTTLIDERNELTVEVESTKGPGGITGEVALEIRSSAFLRNVAIWISAAGKIHASGEVVGTAEQRLELYMIHGRRTAAYLPLESADGPMNFELISEIMEPGFEDIVRVELIAGATVLYGIERSPGTIAHLASR